MSISLVGVMIGLPVALAVRVIMGKEKFDQWLEKSDYILFTDFLSKKEMKTIVEKAGYDVIEWGEGFKTHFAKNSSSYFLWETEDNKIVAKMKTYDDKESIERLVKRVENVAGRKIFSEKTTNQNQEAIERNKIKKMPETVQSLPENIEYAETFPSVYVDAELIMQILERFQISVLSVQENRIVAEYASYKMNFIRSNSDEAFDIQIISEDKKIEELYNCLECLTEEYYASVQEKTYVNIRKQLEEEGMIIEEEEILEDNTIVLTVQV